jgi:hypothetical protein
VKRKLGINDTSAGASRTPTKSGVASGRVTKTPTKRGGANGKKAKMEEDQGDDDLSGDGGVSSPATPSKGKQVKPETDYPDAEDFAAL